MSKRDEKVFGQVVDVIGEQLAGAVQATIEERSPEPARAVVDYLMSIDEDNALDEERPTELIATMALVHWASRVAGEVPDAKPEALGWIEETLGRRYRLRADYTAGALDGEQAAGEILTYRSALRDDFLPSLIWLIAGAVARYGDGDVDWLRKLVERPR